MLLQELKEYFPRLRARLAQLRDQSNRANSEAQLARAAKMRPTQLSRLINGRQTDVRLSTVIRLEEAYEKLKAGVQ